MLSKKPESFIISEVQGSLGCLGIKIPQGLLGGRFLGLVYYSLTSPESSSKV